MTRKQRRLTMIGGSLAVLAIAAALVLNAMRDSIVFFSTPSMAAEKQIPAGKRFRLGGLVQPGSLKRGDNLAVNFSVADGSATLPVDLQGHPARPVPRRAGRRRRRRAGCIRRLPRRHRACQARRDLHAQGSRRRPEEAGPLEGRLRRQAPAGNQACAGSCEMIAEAGHYALVLALASGADPVDRADDRRAARRRRADGDGALDGAGAAAVRRRVLLPADRAARHLGFLRRSTCSRTRIR